MKFREEQETFPSTTWERGRRIMTGRNCVFILFCSLLVVPLAQASGPSPLGATKEQVILSYGQPNSLPIYSGPGDQPTDEQRQNTAFYSSLNPPRTYNFRDNRAVCVHYYDLTGKDFDFIMGLLKFHAVGSEFNEIDPKTIGWESTAFIASKAWRCPRAGWVALYRVDKGAKPRTSPSLLIYVENKK